MKSDRHILTIQTLSILPLLLFLTLYIGTFYLLIPIILLGVNIYRYIKGLDIIRYPILSILIISFIIYALYGLGSREAPQSFETFGRTNKSVSFKFDKKRDIDKFCYYAGIDDNSKFDLEYKEDKEWKNIYKHSDDFPYSFRWNCRDINVTTSEIKLTLHLHSLMIGEVRFIDNDSIIDVKTDHKLLIDESNLSIDKSYFGGMFFDELYHSRTAYEIIHGLNVYETVHPYLGKILITPGIKLFGMTPFGWRIMNVLFGLLFIIVIYYFTLRLFGDRLLAWGGAFMMTFSFMHFTQIRIGLIDTFGVFLIFVSYYLFYQFIKKQTLFYLLLSGIFFGLASAVKWSAFFGSLGFLAIALYLIFTKFPFKKEFKGYKLILYGLSSHILLASIVYIATFFDLYMQSGGIQKIIDYQVHMFSYHSSLQATHAYSSAWWSWILDIKPMCYYREMNGEAFSSITVFGNPALFWMGTISILYLIFISIKKASLEAIFILFAFLGLYLPYMFVSRVMFIYHFYYAVPFMLLGILYMWRDLIRYSPKFYKFFIIFMAIVAGLFLLFYPVLSGYEVTKNYVNSYLVWFSGWWL